MKRFLLSAVLLTAGLASAVTAGWTQLTQPEAYKLKNFVTTATNSGSLALSVKMTGTNPGTYEFGTVLTIRFANDKDLLIGVGPGGNWTVKGGEPSKTVSGVAKQAGLNVVGFAWNSEKWEASVNGKVFASGGAPGALQQYVFASDAKEKNRKPTMFEGFEKVRDNHVYDNVYREMAFSDTYHTADKIYAAVLPEPGVLALLALGVAGLALKRRAC